MRFAAYCSDNISGTVLAALRSPESRSTPSYRLHPDEQGSVGSRVRVLRQE